MIPQMTPRRMLANLVIGLPIGIAVHLPQEVARLCLRRRPAPRGRGAPAIAAHPGVRGMLFLVAFGLLFGLALLVLPDILLRAAARFLSPKESRR